MKWLFGALVLLFLVPIWASVYVPTADGPAHVYNSWLIKELVRGDAGLLGEVYRVDWRPHPNWLGHAVMAVLMFVVPPVIAEKLLFSLIILLFLCGTWLLCGAVHPDSRAYAFIAFQLAYHQLLQTGFYNFSLGIGLYLVLLAWWWKRRDRPDAKTIAVAALLIVLCYFAHPISAALALGSLGLLWLLTLRERPMRQHARHLIAIVPVVPLLAWFVAQRGGETVQEHWSAAKLFNYVFQTEVLVLYGERQLLYGKLMMLAYAALAIATLIRRRGKTNAFGWLTLALIAIFVFSPDSFAGGQLVRERLVLYIYLLPLAWFSPVVPKAVRRAVVVVFAIAAIAKGVFMIDRYRHYSAEVVRYVRSYQGVGTNTTLLPLLADRDTPGAFTGVIGHASGYVAIEKRLVDLDNYEPGTGYFPIAFQPSFPPPDISAIETRPWELDVSPYVSRAQYVFTWKMPGDAALMNSLNRHYRLAADHGEGKVYERMTASLFRPGEKLETVLLPIAGTRASPSPSGRFWRVEQSVRNSGSNAIRVALSSCPELPQCEIDIEPEGSLRLSGDTPYMTLRARTTKPLEFSTRVERVEGANVLTSVEIPAVREDAFREKRISLTGLRFTRNARFNLRVWVRDIGQAAVKVRAIDGSGRTIDETTQLTDLSGFFIHGDVQSLFRSIPENEPVTLECEIDADRGRIWAFATATDNTTERVTLFLR